MADHDTHDHTGITGCGAPADITDIPTADTTTTNVLAPDGVGGVAWRAETGGAGVVSDGASVATGEGTTSGSYTDLSTGGPAVTVTVNTKALVIVGADFYFSNNVGVYGNMGFAVSGANTIAAADAQSCSSASSADNSGRDDRRFERSFFLSGLTPGSTTFTAKYKHGGAGTAYFGDRSIFVLCLD